MQKFLDEKLRESLSDLETVLSKKGGKVLGEKCRPVQIEDSARTLVLQVCRYIAKVYKLQVTNFHSQQKEIIQTHEEFSLEKDKLLGVIVKLEDKVNEMEVYKQRLFAQKSKENYLYKELEDFEQEPTLSE